MILANRCTPAHIIGAGATYFAWTFGAGFLLGAIRVPFVVPHLGVRHAELVEMPLMLAAIIWSARFVVRRFALASTPLVRLSVGCAALALLLSAEFIVAYLYQGQTPGAYIASRDAVSGGVYLALLALFALMPLLVVRRTAYSHPAGTELREHSANSTRSRVRLTSERLFFAWLATAILFMAIVGFSRTYLLVPALGLPVDALPFTPLVHIHGAIFFAWCVLLVGQSWLAVAKRMALHRTLGTLGLALYAGLVVTGPLIAVRSTIRYGSPPDELAFLAVGLWSALGYTLLFGAAFLWRRRPDIHKRLMVVGMVVLLTAPFGRLSTFPFLLQHVVGPGVVIAALWVWDYYAYRSLHFVTVVIGPAVLLWALLPNAFMHSAWWLEVARSLVKMAA